LIQSTAGSSSSRPRRRDLRGPGLRGRRHREPSHRPTSAWIPAPAPGPH